MRMQYRPCVIFSVDRSERSEAANAHARKIAEHDMRSLGIHFEKVLGVYQGQEEYSYIVTQMDKVGLIRGMAKEFDQECIMTRDNENKCNLIYFDGRPPLYLGKLKQVSQAEALANDAYTYSPSLKNYFMCVVE